MTVYVDNARLPYRNMKMCHMIADTKEELFEMARQIGVHKRWFQEYASTPHFDICQSKRTLALKLGAKAVSNQKLVEIIKRLRNDRQIPPTQHPV